MTPSPSFSGLLTRLAAIWFVLAPMTTISSAVTLYASAGINPARFDSATPGSLNVVPITGLVAGNVVIGMDVNNTNGQIYIQAGPTTTGNGRSVNPNGYNVFRLFDLNPITGSATGIGTSGIITNQGSPPIGYDYDPIRNQLRAIASPSSDTTTASNLVQPLNGSFSGATTAPLPVGTIIGGTAITQSGAMYLIGSNGNLIITDVGPSPNLITVGSLGLGSSLSAKMGFDIFQPSGEAFASITVGGLTSLYSINLTTGAASNLGTIGDGSVAYSNMTAIPEPTAAVLGIMGATGWLSRRRRRDCNL